MQGHRSPWTLTQLLNSVSPAWLRTPGASSALILCDQLPLPSCPAAGHSRTTRSGHQGGLALTSSPPRGGSQEWWSWLSPCCFRSLTQKLSSILNWYQCFVTQRGHLFMYLTILRHTFFPLHFLTFLKTQWNLQLLAPHACSGAVCSSKMLSLRWPGYCACISLLVMHVNDGKNMSNLNLKHSLSKDKTNTIKIQLAFYNLP